MNHYIQGPLKPKESSSNDLIDGLMTIQAQQREETPPSRAVRNVAIFDRPAMLLEFEFSKAKARFVDICDKNALLLCEVSPRAHICPRSYAVIFHFVPCKGPFDPDNEEHIHNIEKENDLNASSIISAFWCKHPENRTPNQTMAMLKVACMDTEMANKLLTGHIRVDDHLVNVCKDIHIPIRCIKCQEYGHT